MLSPFMYAFRASSTYTHHPLTFCFFTQPFVAVSQQILCWIFPLKDFLLNSTYPICFFFSAFSDTHLLFVHFAPAFITLKHAQSLPTSTGNDPSLDNSGHFWTKTMTSRISPKNLQAQIMVKAGLSQASGRVLQAAAAAALARTAYYSPTTITSVPAGLPTWLVLLIWRFFANRRTD